VGRAPKDTLANYGVRRRPRVRTRLPHYHHRTDVRELVAGDNSLFVVGLAVEGDMFRFLVPFHTRRGLFIMRIERAEGDKDPVCSSAALSPLPLPSLSLSFSRSPLSQFRKRRLGCRQRTPALCVILFLSQYRHQF